MPDELRKCQAEDQGGWPCDATPVVYRLTLAEVGRHGGKQMYFCKDHRTNKFVWTLAETELIPDDDIGLGETVWCLCNDEKDKFARLRGRTGTLIRLNPRNAVVKYNGVRVSIPTSMVRRHKENTGH